MRMRDDGQADGRTGGRAVRPPQLPLLQTAGPTVGPTAPIVIGTATDPYQPGERRFRVTRQVLERLARCEGLNVGIITKSPLVARDIDVLQRIGERSDLQVHVSLTTVDVGIIRRLEARSPMPVARLRALRRLTAAGIEAGLIVAPVLPGITDDVPHLEALFQAAREAGARFVHSGPLRLYAAVRDRFLPMLDERFPTSPPVIGAPTTDEAVCRATMHARCPP